MSSIILPKLKFVQSPNFSNRSVPVDLIVVHDCEGGYAGSVSWFSQAQSQVSAHYVLKEDGSEATQMVDLDKKAWHAMAFNGRSIGIELGGTAAKGFGDEEVQASANMVAFLLKKYKLPATFARGGKGAGYTSHHSLGRAGGGHNDPTTDDDLFEKRWGTLIQQAYEGGTFPAEWRPGEQSAAAGHDLTWAQTALNKLGRYGTLDIDGDLGPKTKAALQSFQKASKLPQTGQLDEATVDALSAATFNSPKLKSRRG